MKKTIYYWYRNEKPITGELIEKTTEKENGEVIEYLEIKTKYVIAFFWREEGTDQWYDEHTNEVFVSHKKPKYKKPEHIFPLYD